MKVPIRIVFAALIIAGALFSFAGCDKTHDVESETTTTASSPFQGTVVDLTNFVDRTDTANYWVTIDDIQYNTGDPYSKFVEKYEVLFNSPDEKIRPRTQTTLSFYKQSNRGRFIVEIHNPATSAKPRKECVISQITIDNEAAEKFDHHFISGIKVGISTSEDVRKVFGEPTQRSGVLWVYQCSMEDAVELFYKFQFDPITKVLTSCSVGYEALKI